MKAEQIIDCEYVVVGSGAGGGTVAARLAESGRSVAVLEAGGDARQLSGGDPIQSELNRLPSDYDVPAFHAFATENKAIKWDFFVRHFEDDNLQRSDPKYCEFWDGKKVDGVLYPRAGTLGGCTAHNAMILIYPHNSDWDHIAELTGDSSWRAENMRSYFQRIENCRHRPLLRWLSRFGFNPSRHGWLGWLDTEKAIPLAAMRGDHNLAKLILDCGIAALIESGEQIDRIRWAWHGSLDPNDWRLVTQEAVGVRYLPLTTKNRRRIGTRERLLDTARKHSNLRIELDTLTTKILFDKNNRATGVEALQGANLYRAHPVPNQETGRKLTVRVSREVILAGGAFNSPQLLMLSGIGPEPVLQSHNVPLRIHLPGVGANLQDRYEIAVVYKMDFANWAVFEGATFCAGDPQFDRWCANRSSVYDTNGSVFTLFKRSANGGTVPDLFCMALLANFRGYFPNYSALFSKDANYLTWVILKAHTRNNSGKVSLRTADPLDLPQVNFRYFEQGGEADLDAIVEGIRFVRKLMTRIKKRLPATEELPGDDVTSDADLKTFIRSNAWGHHASCTCAIGPRNADGVLSSDFRVHGTENLRVVDASVFPKLPGFFPVSAIYMVGEKAADAILSKST